MAQERQDASEAAEPSSEDRDCEFLMLETLPLRGFTQSAVSERLGGSDPSCVVLRQIAGRGSR